MPIKFDDIQYRTRSRGMVGRLFRDDGYDGTRPAVLVFPEGFGISDHTFEAARRLAAMGYIGLACDLYGDGYFHNGPTAYHVERHAEITSNPAALREIGTSALEFLHARSDVDMHRLAAIGYCLGGTVAIDLGFAGAPLKAIAAFHPTFEGLNLEEVSAMSCPLQLFIGADDYACRPAARMTFEEALSDSKSYWQMTVYGGVKHSFTNPDCRGMGDAVAFNAEATAHSWQDMAGLLKQALA